MYDQNTNQSLFTLRITENTKLNLRSTAAVAGVAAIFSLISALLSLVSTFMARTRPPRFMEGFEDTRASVERTGNILTAVITLVVWGLLFYFLNRFSTQTRQGLNTSNQPMVNTGLGALSGYFVTLGILLIIFLALMLIVFAVGLSVAGR